VADRHSIVASLIGIAGLCGVALAQQPKPESGQPAPFVLREDRKLVKQFDTNGDRRLDLAERKAARAWLAEQPATGIMAVVGRGGGRGGPGAGGPPGMPRFVPGTAGRHVAPADVRSGGSATLYDPGTLRTLFLEFESPDWEQELQAFYSTDVEVPATLTVDGTVYRDVGVHFRGASSFLFVPAGSKRSLNVSLDDVHEDQRLLGYKTLNLLNANSDPTFVRGPLYAEAARQYLPAPKVNHMHVVINGESWGVYLNAQQFDTEFIREHFATRSGARWKVPGSPWGQGGMRYLGDNPEAYKKIYEIKSRDDAKSWAALIGFFKTLTETPLDRLEAALDPLLNIDGALRFLALEIAFANTDGYWTRASDYNIYLDERGKIHILPHDMNEGFEEERVPGGPPPGAPAAAGGAAAGRGAPPGLPGLPPFPPTFGRAQVDLDPLIGMDDANKPLRSRLLAVPKLRARYLAYVREIAEKWLDWKTIEPIARRYQTVIAAEVKADTRKLYSTERFQADLAESPESLKHFADRRRVFLLKTP
jgi:hypothetical protein